MKAKIFEISSYKHAFQPGKHAIAYDIAIDVLLSVNRLLTAKDIPIRFLPLDGYGGQEDHPMFCVVKDWPME